LLITLEADLQAAASIWFEIWRGPDKKKSIFPGKFLRNFDFPAISQQLSIFPSKFSKNFDFFRQIFEKFRYFLAILKEIRFSRQKLLIYSYFWANYYISLQKSPLSNILPVHDKT